MRKSHERETRKVSSLVDFQSRKRVEQAIYISFKRRTDFCSNTLSSVASFLF